MSDNPSKIKDIDLEIFKDEISKCIKPKNDDDVITELCTHCKRLCVASKYYDMLCGAKIDEEERKELLVEFMEAVYHSVLDDTAHFIKEHEVDLQRVWSEWIEQYGFAKCTASKCVKSARHYGRGRRNRKNGNKILNDENSLFAFYQSIFDRFHNYLAHLYEIGLRVDTDSLGKNGDDEKEDADLKEVKVDAVFAMERNHIKSTRKECDLDFDRFDEENNKFTIQTTNNKTDCTLTDALFDKLKERKDIEDEKVHRLKEYLDRNQFDSDGIVADLEDVTDSNVRSLVQSSSLIDSMTAFIRSIECMLSTLYIGIELAAFYFPVLLQNMSLSVRRKAFSTGFIFEYWSKGLPMSITPKYKNLKEEIIESGHLTLREWMEFVELKARRYLRMKRVKKMKSGRAYMSTLHKTNTGHLRKNQPLTFEHLCAVILYCDFGILCTEFSATFRRQNVFEDVESVKARHSKFGHFGRLLVETVLDFGINGREWDSYYGPKPFRFEIGRGPYFCGINCALNIGSYAIRLMGPCSTTTQRSVALNFAKSEGIILRINNNQYESKNQCFFDCSWISNYFEESERLWIASKRPLKIESIVIVKSAKNYEKIIHALWAFDAMIFGVDMANETLDLSAYDLKLISKLFELRLYGDEAVLKKVDRYLVNEWDLFREIKEEIRLDLWEIDKRFKIFSKLILFNVVDNEYETADGMDNVLKGDWISLFPSVHIVRIRTNGCVYKFRLEALLETIKSLSPSVTVVVEDRGCWAREALTDEVSAAFKAEGWNMEHDDKHIPFCGWDNTGGLIIKSNKQ